MTAGGFGDREILVRVNGPTTAWGAADLAAAVAARPDAILLPKGLLPADLAAAAEGRECRRPRTAHPALGNDRDAHGDPEPSGDRRICRGARLAARGFVLGTNDLAKETGARHVPSRLPMLPWLMTAVAAARAYGIAVVDGVYNDLDDEDGFAIECASARDMGFDGKTLIHPRQIELANRNFTPSATEVAWAETVVAAFAVPEAAGVGALKVEGRMVERLHAEMAAKTLTLMRAIAEKDLTPTAA